MPTLPPRLRAFLAQLLAALILFGCFAGWVIGVGAAVELSKLHDARTWTPRRAVLTHSYARHIQPARRAAYWHAELAGTFLDTGQRFGIARVRYGVGNGPWGRREVEEVVANYPKNMQVTVYQSPTDPGQIVLGRDASPAGSWIALAVGLGLGLLPGILYLYGRARRTDTSG